MVKKTRNRKYSKKNFYVSKTVAKYFQTHQLNITGRVQRLIKALDVSNKKKASYLRPYYFDALRSPMKLIRLLVGTVD